MTRWTPRGSMLLAASLATAGCAAPIDGGPADADGDRGSPSRDTRTAQLGYASDRAPLEREVLLLIFDPVIEARDGARLHEVGGWRDPVALTDEAIAWWRETSFERVRFEVVETAFVDDFPIKEDGFAYDDTGYLAVLEDASRHHEPDAADYHAIVEDHDLCRRYAAGELDEVWMFGGPWFGFKESRLAGDEAFFYNSGPLEDTACEGRLPIMGFNYERGLSEMIHDFGHRAESTMDFAYGRRQRDRIDHAWDRFAIQDERAWSYDFSGCGSIHWPPNAERDYDYDNPRSVESMCDDFLGYPELADSPRDVAETISCEAWGCSALGYYRWWFRHLPQATGTQGGCDNDWLAWVIDPERTPGGCTGGGAPGAAICTSDADCESNERCDGGNCIEVVPEEDTSDESPGCSSDAECGSSERCEGGACVASCDPADGCEQHDGSRVCIGEAGTRACPTRPDGVQYCTCTDDGWASCTSGCFL